MPNVDGLPQVVRDFQVKRLVWSAMQQTSAAPPAACDASAHTRKRAKKSASSIITVRTLHLIVCLGPHRVLVVAPWTDRAIASSVDLWIPRVEGTRFWHQVYALCSQ